MNRPTKWTNWVEELAFEVALEYHAPEDLMLKFDLTPEKLDAIRALPDFQRAVNDARRSIDEEGTDFKLLARKLATELLPELASLGASSEVDADNRIKAIKEIAALAGYGKDKAGPDAPSAGFSVTINLGAVEQPVTVNAEPAE